MLPGKRNASSDERFAGSPLASVIVTVVLSLLLLSGCSGSDGQRTPASENASTPAIELASSSDGSLDFSTIPDYSGADYVVLNDNKPAFTEEDLLTEDGTEEYGTLDSLGRATSAFAILCENTRPEPGSTREKDMPDPSGFVQAFYPEAGIDHLYERSHLIAYSLSDEAVNPQDLMTGTHHLNQKVMAEFEQEIRDYLDAHEETGDHGRHVLMRVTPDFRGNELVARGVQIEALSVEDDGAQICFNVYCYNVQPGVTIDYATGASRLEAASRATSRAADSAQGTERAYVLNIKTQTFHYPDCSSVSKMKAKNRQNATASREDLIDQGYKPCAQCKP